MIFLDSLLSGAGQGLQWAILALGVYISFRLLDFPDLTCEGSFTCGGATAAALIVAGVNPWLATLAAILAGAVAGLVTALLNTKLKIPGILAGILTQIALYSVNLRIMGSPNLPLLRRGTVLSDMQSVIRTACFWTDGRIDNLKMYADLLLGLLVAVGVVSLMYWYFGTQSGSAIRATGDNEKMCRAQGINTDHTKILGLMISNALIAFGGALVAQSQSNADAQMGIGSIVIGLASVIIGEAFFGKSLSFYVKLTGVVVGSVLYRIIITLVLSAQLMEASDLKLLTAIMVVAALSLPLLKNKLAHGKQSGRAGQGG